MDHPPHRFSRTLSIRYRPGLPLVLKGVTLTAEPGISVCPSALCAIAHASGDGLHAPHAMCLLRLAVYDLHCGYRWRVWRFAVACVLVDAYSCGVVSGREDRIIWLE